MSQISDVLQGKGYRLLIAVAQAQAGWWRQNANEREAIFMVLV